MSFMLIMRSGQRAARQRGLEAAIKRAKRRRPMTACGHCSYGPQLAARR
jgi:hypothetical protein